MNAPSRAPSNSASSTERARAFRARQRAKGLKLKQFWVPDLNNPEVLARIRADCEAINAADKQDDIFEFLDAVNAWPE